MARVGKVYPTCQTCGKWFHNKVLAAAHVLKNPGHKIKGG